MTTSPVKVQSQTLTQFQQPPAILVTRCRVHKPIQPEILMSEHEKVADFEPTGIVRIISGFPEPWSKGLPNATKCVTCVVSGFQRCCEMLLDPATWKSSKPVPGRMAKTRLLWNIIMKPNLGSFQQDCIWCPAQMDTIIKSWGTQYFTLIMINRYMILFGDDNKMSSLMNDWYIYKKLYLLLRRYLLCSGLKSYYMSYFTFMCNSPACVPYKLLNEAWSVHKNMSRSANQWFC